MVGNFDTNCPSLFTWSETCWGYWCGSCTGSKTYQKISLQRSQSEVQKNLDTNCSNIFFQKMWAQRILLGFEHVWPHDQRKGAPEKCCTTSFWPSKVAQDFPIFRSYFRMEYDQPWNMGRIPLEFHISTEKNIHKYQPFGVNKMVPVPGLWQIAKRNR